MHFGRLAQDGAMRGLGKFAQANNLSQQLLRTMLLNPAMTAQELFVVAPLGLTEPSRAQGQGSPALESPDIRISRFPRSANRVSLS